MDKFVTFEGLVAPLDRANVDTDQIIPKQFLKSIKRTGFGPNLFDEWRYRDEGEPGQDCSGRPLNEDFILNQSRYKGAQVLITRRNFGCGSSREHAPWALLDYGFKAVIAPSFADIFFNNCFKNGLLPIVLSEEAIETLFQSTVSKEGFTLSVDLESQVIARSGAKDITFEVDVFRKYCLINGLDDISLTLKDEAAIRQYEDNCRQHSPWLFDAIK
ncbi:MAG: 3-isopropylmalate dehydratase small subunit [Pseudomonadales bacterium]|nr:3-isopropylmalate dehydratase small subunit [Pseudomonadales bacterium]